MGEKGIEPMQLNKGEQIKLAAFVFSRITREAGEIANALGCSPRTVQRMIHDQKFQAELDRWEYQGERNFHASKPRQPHRSPDHETVKRLWYELTDIPEHKRVRAIADRVDTPYNTVRAWIRDLRKETTTE